MQQVKQTQSECQKLEDEFKGATVDMQSKFLQALAAEGFLDNERLINTNIDEVYGPLRTQVAEIVESQKELIEKIQVRNTQGALAQNHWITLLTTQKIKVQN